MSLYYPLGDYTRVPRWASNAGTGNLCRLRRTGCYAHRTAGEHTPGMMEGANVSWMPSYGPEMRGGTANCQVVVSPKEVSSPLVTEPTSLIALNKPSLDKFAPWVRRGGSSSTTLLLLTLPPERTDVRVLAVPANKIANELGDLRIANMVALGAYLATTRVVGSDTVLDALKKVLPERRHNLIPLNRQRLRAVLKLPQYGIHGIRGKSAGLNELRRSCLGSIDTYVASDTLPLLPFNQYLATCNSGELCKSIDYRSN